MHSAGPTNINEPCEEGEGGEVRRVEAGEAGGGGIGEEDAAGVGLEGGVVEGVEAEGGAKSYVLCVVLSTRLENRQRPVGHLFLRQLQM